MTSTTYTETQVNAALNLLKTMGELIREAGSVPSGTLYAGLMGVLTLSQYESMIDVLLGSGLVTRDRSHLLTWMGPR